MIGSTLTAPVVDGKKLGAGFHDGGDKSKVT
jgi:hypothetical protein